MAIKAHRRWVFTLLRLIAQADCWAVVLLASGCACMYGRYVLTDHISAGGDFPTGMSYALNFRKAFDDGQWLPRWLVVAREGTLGGG